MGRFSEQVWGDSNERHHRAALAGAVDPDEHRSKGQIMADELVRRVLTPGEGEPDVPGIELHVVMTDRTLLDGDEEPAQVVGYGPVPAPVARDLVRADSKTKVWVRRLYTNPETGELAGTDARKRDFPDVVRQFFLVRDQVCRTPWCGAPIRHVDHAVAVAKGGVTDLRNGNGRCARCNLTKDLPGWVSVLRDGAIVTSTPTGQQYASRPPRPPRSDSWESADDLPATTGG
ncbi:HNH endonuclease [Nakamurella multipartita]|uniref:HNH endonuclease n=1 Tax=Nakamurella multipartita TaxID=53461 RepID=UPI00019E8479|nr:HNH endonuclease [Nakamurella multipartita]